MRANLQVAQRQSVLVTTQTIQSIQLLQYGHEELEAFLSEQAESNPFLEVRQGKSSGLDVTERFGTKETATMPRGNASDGHEVRANLEDYCAARPSLRDHLHSQLVLLQRDPISARIAGLIVDSLDSDGYFRRGLEEMCDTLGLEPPLVQAALRDVQMLEPVGVGARSLAECLRLQLADRGWLSSEMDRLIDHLDLVAKFDIPQLTRRCGVSREKVIELIERVRQLSPRPGSSFDPDPVVVAVPDIYVRRRPNGTFGIELNSRLMPRVLVNRQYYAEVRAGGLAGEDKCFVADRMQQAGWIAKQMEQRANTILKVAAEIVSQQSSFFQHGAEHLRPLNLRDVADAIDVHPSTVCRAIANKFMLTDRGTFEMRYFFANAIASSDGGEEQSSHTIRFRIREMIDGERAGGILSDDAIVVGLRREGIDIARRTVAKYREMLRIPSSSVRRRLKQASGAHETFQSSAHSLVA